MKVLVIGRREAQCAIRGVGKQTMDLTHRCQLLDVKYQGNNVFNERVRKTTR
jgi:hypothetical protein